MQVHVVLVTVACCLVFTADVMESSVMMRAEECHTGTSSSGKKCATGRDQQPSVSDNKLRKSVLGVDLTGGAQQNNTRFTPLPYAAFMQPRPVYQTSEERVFNVLEKERNVGRLLKGGKRQEDRIRGNSTLNESEDTSRSNVKFRKRKGGKRSDRRKQLRRERIEKKRTRRKNRRMNRQDKKNRNKHPKHKRKGRKRKVKRGKLKSLDFRGRRRRNREQIGANSTIFIENPVPAAVVLPESNTISSRLSLEANAMPQQLIVEDPEVSVSSSRIIGDQTNMSVDNSRKLDNEINIGADSSRTYGLHHTPYIDIHNYHENNFKTDDYDSEEDVDLLTDTEYSTSNTDDYKISPDYFNWSDNSSIDYFTQGEDTTVTSDTWPGSRHLDPSHIEIRRHLVRIHNLLRSKVDPPAANMLALSWHGAAATQARQWAESCVTHRGRDHPSVRWTPRYGACGQNVLVTRRRRRWAHVIRNWWSERRFFQYGSSDLRNATYRARSYTQLAWYSSHKVGCGYSHCTTTSGRSFHRYVCNYCPAGNDPSRLSLPYTRGRPCEMCPTACRSVCPAGQCRLCTNRCPFSDLWANCDTLAQRWREWLCNTKTLPGVERFKNCRATCQCALAGDKIL